MKFVFAVLLLTGLVGLSNAQTCGLTDKGVHIPPNYTTMTPPAYGQSYTDPVFGCQITRLVNGTHEYSEMSAFNANDTNIIVGIQQDSGRRHHGLQRQPDLQWFLMWAAVRAALG